MKFPKLIDWGEEKEEAVGPPSMKWTGPVERVVEGGKLGETMEEEALEKETDKMLKRTKREK